MVQTKHLPGFLVAVLYWMAAALLAVVLLRVGGSDGWLYLLVPPVLLAAAFYPRWVYFAMSLGTFLSAATVVLSRTPGGGVGLRNIFVVIALILANSELLHRMMRARLRAESGLRELLEREKEARALALAAQERFAFLAGASDSLAGSLDLRTTLDQAARQAVPYLADVCAVRLAAGGGEHEPIAIAHADPAKEGALAELRDRYGLDLGLPQPAEAALYVEVADETLAAAARDEEHRRLLRELSPCSAILVPLAGQEQVLGSMAFVMSESGRRYRSEDVDLAKELARRAAIALENAGLHHAIREADRRKVEFLAMLAHELRNPLAAISNSGYVLEQTTQESARTGRFVGAITRQARHLARLVDDLLEVSRITEGKLALRKEPVEIVAATHEAIESVRPFVEARRHRLHVSLPEGKVWIEADPTRYEQILVNLLGNAAKYTEDGGEIWVSVEVGAVERGEGKGERGSMGSMGSMGRGATPHTPHTPHTPLTPLTPLTPHTSPHPSPLSAAVIRVRDTGVGIAPELLPRMFDLFTQGETPATDSRGGLGIGLTLVRRLVELHGGNVTAWSEGSGRGSEFTVTLPVLKSAVSGQWLVVSGQPSADSTSPQDWGAERSARHALTSTRAGGPTPTPNAQRLSRSVLIVDDDRDAAETLSELLEMWGHRVWLARDGARGLDAARAHRPEVALLDIGMPGMDGYEVARRLRAGPETREMVLVALTGYGADEDRKRAREAGFDHHLVKPADPEELQRLLMGA